MNFIEEGKLGGPQTRIVRVAASISSEVETIVVMPSENSEDFQKLCANSNISYQTIKISRITKELSILMRYIFCFPIELFRIFTLFKKLKPDLVHVSGGAWQFRSIDCEALQASCDLAFK